MYAQLIKPIAFKFQAETAHYATFNALTALYNTPGGKQFLRYLYQVPLLESDGTTLCGISFPNKVGLAAGLDKNARWLDPLATLGFGFVEIGTITPLPQSGNPKPRLFRLPEDSGLINRMGFNNDGVKAVAKRLEKRPSNLIVGGNIGKNKITENSNAEQDYAICFDVLQDLVDYFVINVSSPNTPGLRELQDKGPLTAIIRTIENLNQKRKTRKPVFLKIAPDLTEGQLADIIELATQEPLDGLIATNTTIERNGLMTSKSEVEAIGMGGLSGAPVKLKSNTVLASLRAQLPSDYPLIGVGGICSGQDAREKMELGADLIQLYSGLIYAGPALIADSIRAIRNVK